MADFTFPAPGPEPPRRPLFQRLRQWLRPTAAPARKLISMRPNGSLPYVGEIAIFAGNFAPVGWLFCDGSYLQISEYDTLFQLIGTTYGGDGENNFCLPDLRGRLALHPGTGPGLSSYYQGEKDGVESVTLSVNQIPSHTHQPAASTAPGTSASPVGTVPANSGSGSAQYTTATTGLLTQPVQTLTVAGGSQPHTNLQPYLTLNYIISLYGVFPSQL
jgi:microcystin-dependent protein